MSAPQRRATAALAAVFLLASVACAALGPPPEGPRGKFADAVLLFNLTAEPAIGWTEYLAAQKTAGANISPAEVRIARQVVGIVAEGHKVILDANMALQLGDFSENGYTMTAQSLLRLTNRLRVMLPAEVLK